jgi:hypothetical protein
MKYFIAAIIVITLWTALILAAIRNRRAASEIGSQVEELRGEIQALVIEDPYPAQRLAALRNTIVTFRRQANEANEISSLVESSIRRNTDAAAEIEPDGKNIVWRTMHSSRGGQLLPRKVRLSIPSDHSVTVRTRFVGKDRRVVKDQQEFEVIGSSEFTVPSGDHVLELKLVDDAPEGHWAIEVTCDGHRFVKVVDLKRNRRTGGLSGHSDPVQQHTLRTSLSLWTARPSPLGDVRIQFSLVAN